MSLPTNPCPSPDELLAHSLFADSSSTAAARVDHHVQGCTRCRDEVADLRSAATRLRVAMSTEPTTDTPHLDDSTIAALAEGSAEDPGVTQHLLACNQCSDRLASVVRLLGAEGVAIELGDVEARPKRGRRRLRWTLIAGGIAAAAMVLLVARSTLVPPTPDARYRDESVTLASPPRPVAPIGTVTRHVSLVWRSVPDAFQYRLTLFGEDGTTLWTSQSSDTAAALPPSVPLTPGSTYLWKVEARIDWNRWTASEMVQFKVER